MITLAAYRAEIEAERARPGAVAMPDLFRGGAFIGQNPRFAWIGPRSYYFFQDDDAGPFGFRRPSGQVITPGEFVSDGGSIPRIFWLIPDLDPWTYFPAYLIHDWACVSHHKGRDILSFEDANLVLADAIRALIDAGRAPGTLLGIEAIYRAVSSHFGRELWDRKALDG